jgi:O-antigen ligase
VLVSIPYWSRIIEEAFFPDFNIAGNGVVFLCFIPFLVLTIVKNPGAFAFAARNMVIIGLALFIISCGLIESFHTNSDYTDVIRSFFMALSIPLFAVWVARDIRYFYIIIYSFVTYCAVIVLNLCSVDPREIMASGGGDSLRADILDKAFFFFNLNGAGYLAGTAAFLLFLLLKRAKSTVNKYLLIILLILSTYVLFICVSRSAYLNFTILLLVYFYKSGIRLKPHHYLVMLGVVSLVVSSNLNGIEDILFSRFGDISLEDVESDDSRSRLYSKLIKHADEAFVSGVGEGNYYGDWGLNSEIAKQRYDYELGTMTYYVPAAHNSIFQILYYWGFFPVLVYILIFILLYLYLPKNNKDLPVMICFLLFSSTLTLVVLSNNFNNKDFAMIFGLIIGLKMNMDSRKHQLHLQHELAKSALH